MTRLVCALWLLSFLLAAPHARADCDQCQDLCQLMDVYLERDMGAFIWQQYAASTPPPLRSLLPANVTETQSMEAQGLKEFNAWTTIRRLPCVPPPPPPGAAAPSGATTILSTNGLHPSCTIYYGTEPIDFPGVRDRFERSMHCKAVSDATIAHEEVHRDHCLKGFATNPALAPIELDRPENVAESEYQAWTQEQRVLEAAIRDILAKKGCGWDPTPRQRKDPSSLPSVTQMKDMQRRAWEAATELYPIP